MHSGFEVVFFVPDQCLASDGSPVVLCQRINVSKPSVGGIVMLPLPATIDIEAEITLSGGEMAESLRGPLGKAASKHAHQSSAEHILGIRPKVSVQARHVPIVRVRVRFH